ncbi:MAG TPA: sigma factor-like helix-turn-helix DNA-binding protein [Roseiarcus sp.]|nr:sigma factor-like helix-turn-helix DNA-binding protein [Roseiarcus sp.]
MLSSTAEWREEARAVRRFAVALASDERFARDRGAAALVADSLVNRALLALHNGEGPAALSRRLRLLCLLVRFHRRHIHLRSFDEDCPESGFAGGAPMERAVAALPAEWREALLLVAIERLSHQEAAAVLEISLAALLDRLARARAALSQASSAAPERRNAAPHLRLIK